MCATQISATSVQHLQQDARSDGHVPLHVTDLHVPGTKISTDTCFLSLLVFPPYLNTFGIHVAGIPPGGSGSGPVNV